MSEEEFQQGSNNDNQEFLLENYHIEFETITSDTFIEIFNLFEEGWTPAVQCLIFWYGEYPLFQSLISQKIQQYEALAKEIQDNALINHGINESDVLFHLGLCYEFGLILEKDEVKALDYYLSAINKKDNNKILAYLGYYYVKGRGGKKNISLGLSYLNQAIESSNILAMVYLGQCYEFGFGVNQNEELAFFWYEKAANLGNLVAIGCLGDCFEKGYGVEEDIEQAITFYKQAAKLGNIESMFEIGLLYHSGQALSPNEVGIIDYYTQAAERGHVPAMFNLHICYLYAEGIPDPDDRKAIRWLKIAVKYGYAPAMSELGSRLLMIDDEAALSLFYLAASLHEPSAIYRLANCYKNGVAVHDDISEYLYWLRVGFELYPEKTDEDYDVEFLAGLGEMYRDGQLRKDLNKAKKYFLKVKDSFLTRDLFKDHPVLYINKLD